MRITTDRLILRDFVEDDWPPMLAWQRDPRHFRYYAWTEDRTEADVRALLQRFLDELKVQPRRRFQLAITLPETGQIIGDAGIRRKAENDWEADIGYELAPEHWGNGYATEAARALVDMGFHEWGLHRISSWCIAGNAASARVLERVGLRQEGRLRENEYFKGRWWDSLLYGLLVDEWSASGSSD